MWSRLYRTFSHTKVEQPRAVFRRVLRLAAPYRTRLFAAAACMLLLALTTSAYAYVVGPLLRFIYAGGGSPSGFGAVGRWLGDWLATDPGNMAVLLSVMVVGLAIVKGLASYGELSLMGAVGQNTIHDIRRNLMDRVLSLAPDQLLADERGDLASRFMIDVALMEGVVTWGVTALVRDLLQAAALLTLAIYLDPVLGLLAIAILPVTSWIIVAISRRTRRTQRGAQDALGALASRVEETAGGLSVIRHHGAEATQAARFAAANRGAREEQLRAIRIRAFASPLMELLGAAALAGTLWYAQSRVSSGEISPERFVSFFTAIFLLYGPVKSLGSVANLLQSGLAGADRVFRLLDRVPTRIREGVDEPPPLARSLSLQGVKFRRGDNVVLDGLDLEIRAGERFALVGRSGAGKTTTAQILSRLLDADEGTILWDGELIERYAGAGVRRQISVVPQDSFLFHDTVRANITLGAAPGKLGVEEAARLAGLEPLFARLEKGIDTDVGEGGGRLSGGERQRICIARALYHGGSLLLLDEAVSSLDATAEAEVAAALDRAAQGRTTLIIAHRLSSVRRADRIAVLDGGRIVETGTFDELLARGGPFVDIFRDQLVREAPASPVAGDQP
ncbi:MAG: ABC transporter ATP-binding protein [Deltaproteobacteria bacterium]|nr:ABC transporter ATP-binding protein [Deltaproteobacteria bacterium]